MNTTCEYELLRLERFRPNRRRGWKRPAGCLLWVMVAMLIAAALCWRWLAHGMGHGAWGVESEVHGVCLAGFGVPDWVAVGIVGMVVAGLLARLAWGAMVDAEEMSTYSDERWDPYVGDKPEEARHEGVGGGVGVGTACIASRSDAGGGGVEGVMMQPARHGFVIDLQDGERRVHVRVFEFERQEFLPGNWCEMPVGMDVPLLMVRLRECMEFVREEMRAKAVNGKGGEVR